MSSLTDALWERYQTTGDPVARAQLLDSYLGLVHHSARELSRRVGPDIEYDDLLGSGTLGLVQALETFEPARGLAFSTLAVPRIRGAMLDELRRRDWLPRSARERARQVAQARATLERALERAPDEHEMSEHLGVDLGTYRRWAERIEMPVFLPLDEPIAGSGGDIALQETLADPASADPADAMAGTARLAALGEALGALPERERLILTLSYFEELSLKQIGEVLHVTESRVSQLRTRALRRLREAAELSEAA